jgi:hypothetical protein
MPWCTPRVNTHTHTHKRAPASLLSLAPAAARAPAAPRPPGAHTPLRGSGGARGGSGAGGHCLPQPPQQQPVWVVVVGVGGGAAAVSLAENTDKCGYECSNWTTGCVDEAAGNEGTVHGPTTKGDLDMPPAPSKQPTAPSTHPHLLLGCCQCCCQARWRHMDAPVLSRLPLQPAILTHHHILRVAAEHTDTGVGGSRECQRQEHDQYLDALCGSTDFVGCCCCCCQ